MRASIAALIVGFALVVLCSTAAAQYDPPAASKVTVALGDLPLYFVENRGVYPDEVRYYIQGVDKTLFFTDQGVTIALQGKERCWTVKLDFVGANERVRPVGLDKQPAVLSYFTGAEKDWKAGLPTFAKIVYRDLWPGIDLVYNGTVNKLKYEFRVAPGADPKLIRLQYRGARAVTATDAGALRVETPEGSFEDAPPLAWQEIDGMRVPVEMAYTLGEDGAFGFTLGEYDHTRPLILDPAVIVYCGYIGGSASDDTNDLAVDAQGCVYVVGFTKSTEKTFPETVGPGLTFKSTTNVNDAFVAKVSAAGDRLLYCGYIGGDKSDRAYGVAVDSKGAAYVAGQTNSTPSTFPRKGGPSTTYSGGNDAFVAKVNPSGKSLDYCGYIGGTNLERAMDIAVDKLGQAYVTGFTTSTENQGFPVKTGPDLTHNGGYDCFVARVAVSGGSLDYCGYIGGTKNDARNYKAAIAVDGAGAAYVASTTESTESHGFPVTSGAWDKTFGGGVEDHFAAKVAPTGKSLLYCGYIGGTSNERSSNGGECDIAVDAAGCAHVVGQTGVGTGFPVKNGPSTTIAGSTDAYIVKISPTGSTLVYGGFIGGTQIESGLGVAVDRTGNAYVGGFTSSDTTNHKFPAKIGPGLTYSGGTWDGFVAKVGPTGVLLTCGYVGGEGNDKLLDVAVDPAGNVYVCGETTSVKTFPLRVGPSLAYQGSGNVYVAKIALLAGLTRSGSGGIGTTVSLNLAALEARGLPYQMGTSLGSGPIPVDTRWIGLTVDDVLLLSVSGLVPSVFQGYTGKLDSQGRATARIVILNDARLKGVRLHSAFVTLDPTWPSATRSISETRSFTIQ